jgi:hypothetical protein
MIIRTFMVLPYLPDLETGAKGNFTTETQRHGLSLYYFKAVPLCLCGEMPSTSLSTPKTT